MIAPEKWNSLNEYEQLGNVGSAFFRASKGATTYDEFFKLLELTTADPKWKGRTKELLILQDVAADLMDKTNIYQVKPEQLNEYFLGFALVARANR